MTRDEAIEAGARAVRNSMFPLLDVDETHPVAAGWRATAAAVLDAIGWAEPGDEHHTMEELYLPVDGHDAVPASKEGGA